MPGLKELTNFRNNLQTIANEQDVTSQWKERFEEYPYPENPPLPDLDVDALLDDIDIPEAPNDAEVSEDEGISSNEVIEPLDSFVPNIDKEDVSSNLDEIDLPPPETFSMPTDVNFTNVSSIEEPFLDEKTDDSLLDVLDDDLKKVGKDGNNDEPNFDIDSQKLENNGDIQNFELPPSLTNDNEEVISKPLKSKKIDLEKWNAEDNKDEVLPEKSNDISSESIDRLSVPLNDSLKDDDFPNQSEVQDDSLSEGIDLSQFDMDNPNDETEEKPSPEDEEIDKLVGDINNEVFPSVSEIEGADAPSFNLPAFDPDEFGSVEDDEKDVSDVSDDTLTTEDDIESKTSFDDIPALGEEPVENEEPLSVDLSGFDPDSLSISRESTDKEDDIEQVNNLDSLDEEKIPSIDDVSLENEKAGSLEEPQDILGDDVEEIENIEDADEVESLKDENDSSFAPDVENLDVLDVENISDEPSLEDNKDVEDISTLSNESDEVEELNDDSDVNLETFDFDSPSGNVESVPSADVDLYTEEENTPKDESPVAPSASSIPDEFNSFGNIDISSGGDETAIDEHAAFSISNDILDENISDTVGGFSVPDDFTQFSQGKSASSTQKVKDKADEDIPLSITEAEYQSLIDRISSFPLNVRLEIEDYLAHNDDTAISKMEFVHLIVSGAKLKKIASSLSEILDKPIQIPKGFERRSAEEYEKEKKSFKWKLRHKIIPFASIITIILVLVSCISFLTWMFVYKPIVSETIYNRGYTLLQKNKYSDAVKEFERAGEYVRKKRWYFKYANGFREKKQFKLAEDIYRWILFDFNHDKQGGLEYASMLRDDLHNYEKAENVLKRSVLDYHANDETALLALGDTYLEWAREKPDKFNKAKDTYASLINMYGTKDIFLSRLMKYFIRTDRLGEVLPLKAHFVDNLKRLETDDLTELGSYLIKKRYEDKDENNEYLNSAIDDVRKILESSLKRDEENANANYNMGRFFLYNRKLDVASYYLAKSIDNYKMSNNLSSESIMNSVNAMRLYGEILSQNKEYLKAQEAYADALSKYKEFSENRLISPDKNIGKLYQDYGDINYFISGDLQKALQAYNMAIKEMNDTPSIQYKIGYINYQNKSYEEAMRAFLLVHSEKQTDKNLLYGLGNTLYKRGSYEVAQGYYERLMEILEAEKIRKHVLFPNSRPDHSAFVDEYMRSTNNLAVILNKLAMQNGNSEKNGRALFLFGESSRAWDALTRNPETMVASKALSLAYLNTQNIIKPQAGFEAEIYSDIPKTLENESILQKEVDR